MNEEGELNASPDESALDASLATKLIEGGAEMAGASVGAAVGLIGGPIGVVGGAALGVTVAQGLRRVGAEIQQRWLGPRQRVRVGAVFAMAVANIKLRQDAGELPRSDGFFEASVAGDRPAAEELLEGVLLAASDAYEEQKLPFLAKLYAGLVFETGVDRSHANFLLTLAQRLTFRQMILMAVLWEGDAAPLVAEAAASESPRSLQFDDEMALEVDGLEQRGLVRTGEPGGTPKRQGIPFSSAGALAVSDLTLTAPGKRLYELMSLRDIPPESRRSVLDHHLE